MGTIPPPFSVSHLTSTPITTPPPTQRALHEFCFHNFVVALPSHAPPTKSAAWAHPPVSVAEALAALADKGAGDKGRALVGSYEPVLERHRFMALPKVSVRLQYNWECLDGGSPFKHHIQVP